MSTRGRGGGAPIQTDDAIVLLLGAPGGRRAGYLEGITRLEKLIFLLERETPARAWLSESAGFRSYRFGPFSSRIYHMIDKLAAASIVREYTDAAKRPDGSPSAEDRWEAANAVIDPRDIDQYTTRNFELTPRGQRYYQVLLQELPPDAEQQLAAFKKRFAGLPLRQLVRYVYERYPQFTDRSEIKDDILR